MTTSPLTRHDWQTNEISALFALPFNELLFQAASIHRQRFDPNAIQTSTLLSIKTGGCPENCSYCPQSAHYNTNVEKEDLLDTAQVVTQAKQAKEAGATRFCMGAAWRQVPDRSVPQLCDMIEQIKGLGMESCMTLGMANKEQLSQLKQAGLDFYNHNIDSSESFYEKIISTRGYQDRLDTLKNIDETGLNTCSGGIVGMGETVDDRVEMLKTLANLSTHPKSVPINQLVPVEGTPLEDQQTIDPFDFVRTIAVARILMPKSYVRLSAGRREMSDTMQALCFFAGANSIFYGDKLLTTDNPDFSADMTLLGKLGMMVEKAPESSAA